MTSLVILEKKKITCSPPLQKKYLGERTFFMDLKIAEDVAERTLNQLMNSDMKKKDPIQLKKTLVQQRWEIIERLGSGGFGLIYKGNFFF